MCFSKSYSWLILSILTMGPLLVGCSREREPAPGMVENDGLGDDGIGLFPDEVDRIQENAVVDGERRAVRRGARATRPVDPYTAQYDPQTVVSYPGDVVGLSRIPLSHDRTGLLVNLHVGGEFPRVYLGPADWLNDHGLRPGIGDRMYVTGSRYRPANRNMLIASRIGRGDDALVLRDEDGTPRWPVPDEDDN